MTRFRAMCDCGDHSTPVPSRAIAENWAEGHRQKCEYLTGRERTIGIEEVGS